MTVWYAWLLGLFDRPGLADGRLGMTSQSARRRADSVTPEHGLASRTPTRSIARAPD